MLLPRLWQYGLWSFQMGGKKLERFLPKNQHTYFSVPNRRAVRNKHAGGKILKKH